MIISVVHMDDSGSWARIGLIVVFLRRKKYQRKIYKYFLDDIILQLILIFSRFVSFLRLQGNFKKSGSFGIKFGSFSYIIKEKELSQRNTFYELRFVIIT